MGPLKGEYSLKEVFFGFEITSRGKNREKGNPMNKTW